MANPWVLYQSHPSFVLGFHGTENNIARALINRVEGHLKHSVGSFEWLGHGIYFWENDPLRAYEWAAAGNAKAEIEEPDAVGAILDLRLCLDLMTRSGLEEVSTAFRFLCQSYKEAGAEMPMNTGGPDKLRRELDCQVIEVLHKYREAAGQPPYDSVRAPFREDEALYPGAGFHRRTHTQIAIRNPDCIKGYFRPISRLP